MQAVRCTECGETRWTPFSRILAQKLDARCESCGGRLEVERRTPGHAPDRLQRERRVSEPRAPRV